MNIIDYVSLTLNDDQSGHDLNHIKRVLAMARYLQKHEGGNLRIIEAAVYLHDCIDSKLFKDIDKKKIQIKDLLIDNHYSKPEVEAIFSIIENMSWHQHQSLETIEGKIVQDADRLDAIGAVGAIRAIEYGNRKNRKFYDEINLKKDNDSLSFNKTSNSTLSHFYEKLLLIKDQLNTKTAIEIANKRHKFLLDFLNEFFDELNY